MGRQERDVDDQNRDRLWGADTGDYKSLRAAERYSQLPEGTRKWLELLRDEDIRELKEATRFYRNAKTVGKFWRWALITVFGAFITAVTFGEKFMEFVNWIRGAKP